ncbi:hypothetical protein OQA88_9156 [Cercophora sp. LCS_1]
MEPKPQSSANLETGLGPIARLVQTVLRNSRALADAIKPEENEPGDSFNMQQVLPLFDNEFVRFKMWVGNLGAHQTGRASLDYRLREASHLQEQVIHLLQDASESLQEALAITQPKNGAMDEDEQQHSGDSPDDASEDSFTDSDPDEPSSESRLSTLCADIREVIDCLLRLSVAIANPAPHERFRKFGAEDVSYRQPTDIAYVRDKFPRLTHEMAEVLGKSITRRRQFFRYRMAHREKLAAGLEDVSTVKDKDDSLTEILPKTVASTLPEHIKANLNLNLRKDVIDEDTRSDTAESMTSYATSAGLSAEMRGGETVPPPPPLRVPSLPIQAKLGSFECPFCYRVISVSSRAAWK